MWRVIQLPIIAVMLIDLILEFTFGCHYISVDSLLRQEKYDKIMAFIKRIYHEDVCDQMIIKAKEARAVMAAQESQKEEQKLMKCKNKVGQSECEFQKEKQSISNNSRRKRNEFIMSLFLASVMNFSFHQQGLQVYSFRFLLDPSQDQDDQQKEASFWITIAQVVDLIFKVMFVVFHGAIKRRKKQMMSGLLLIGVIWMIFFISYLFENYFVPKVTLVFAIGLYGGTQVNSFFSFLPILFSQSMIGFTVSMMLLINFLSTLVMPYYNFDGSTETLAICSFVYMLCCVALIIACQFLLIDTYKKSKQDIQDIYERGLCQKKKNVKKNKIDQK